MNGNRYIVGPFREVAALLWRAGRVFALGLLHLLRFLWRRAATKVGGYVVGSAVIFLFVCYFIGVPLLRYAVGSFFLPWRTGQYLVSPYRLEADIVGESFGVGTGSGWSEDLPRRAAFWVVYRGLEEAGLSAMKKAVVLAMVNQESSFRPLAKNAESSACGLFQITRETGRRYDLPPYLCMDAKANTRAGVKLTLDYTEKIGPPLRQSMASYAKCAYLMHYYGIGNGCAKDRSGIWSRVGPGLIKAAQRAELSYKRITEEKRGLWIIWWWLRSYAPLLLIAAALYGTGFVLSYRETMRKAKK